VGDNRVELAGRLAETSGLRYTPAGLASLQLRLEHRSTQREAGRERPVACDLEALAFGEVAQALSGIAPGEGLRLTGFLERKSARNPQTVMHVTEFVLIEE